MGFPASYNADVLARKHGQKIRGTEAIRLDWVTA